MSLSRNKRAVSPLLTTILLIGFAVALGVVVINWGKSTVEAVHYDCGEDVQISVVEVNGIKRICLDENKGMLVFTIENGPHVELSSIKGHIMTESDVHRFEVEQQIKKADITKIEVDYDKVTYGPISSVRITPAIIIEETGELKYCSDNMIEIAEISSCE